MTKRKMHPAWAFFFKDRYAILKNQQSMSLAEVLFAASVVGGAICWATQQDMCNTCDSMAVEATTDEA